MKAFPSWDLAVLCMLVALLILEVADAVGIRELKDRERQDRALIAQVQANYAASADFRNLVERSAR